MNQKLLPSRSRISWPPASSSLPLLPGVYWFLDADKQVLYIGKAKVLRHRLLSYRHSQGKTKLMLASAKTIGFKVLKSDIHALITEANLIKSLQPKYNILLRSGSSPVYIFFTNDKYPRVITNREFIPDAFGPYPSQYQVHELLKFLRRIFPYCSSQKPCFYRHLNLCPGACTQSISVSAYKQTIRRLKLFLSGKFLTLTRQLKRQMLSASKHQDYELASLIKHQLDLIERLNSFRLASHDLANLPRRIEAYDIAHLSGTASTGSMVVFIDGRPEPSLYRHFRIKHAPTNDDYAMIHEIVSRRRNHPEWGIPDLILIDGGRGQLHAAHSAWPEISMHALAKKTEILYPKSNLPLTLFQHLRDEAHRFSRRLHHRLRQRYLLQ